MKVIVGLGNPGAEYYATRHNAGFRVLEELARANMFHFLRKSDLECDLAKVKFADHDVLMIKPLTYMNLTGRCVQKVLHWFKIAPAQMLVVHDDVSLPLGRLRLQKDGGAGGQHGVESIIEFLGGLKAFDRLKIGVGPDPGGDVRAAYVLSAPPPAERDLFNECILRAGQAAIAWLELGMAKAMNKYNGMDVGLELLRQTNADQQTAPDNV